MQMDLITADYRAYYVNAASFQLCWAAPSCYFNEFAMSSPIVLWYTFVTKDGEKNRNSFMDRYSSQSQKIAQNKHDTNASNKK